MLEIIPTRTWVEFFRPLLEATPLQLNAIRAETKFIRASANRDENPVTQAFLLLSAEQMERDLAAEIIQRN